MTFIHPLQIPSNQEVTYASFVCDHRPLKLEQWRVRLVVGGDKLSCLYDTESPAANLLETKLVLNSIISDSDKGARFMTSGLKDHFLASPMQTPQTNIPPDIINKYNLQSKFHNGYICCEINKGRYGLKQAALLAYNFLVKILEPYGHHPVPHTIGIWKHKSRPITFCVCVDDFDVKNFYKHNVHHLINALQQHYKLSIAWEGKHYNEFNLQWNYKDHFVDITMPDDIPAVLKRISTY